MDRLSYPRQQAIYTTQALLGGLVVPLTASMVEKVAYAHFINRVKEELSQETVTKVITELKESVN